MSNAILKGKKLQKIDEILVIFRVFFVSLGNGRNSNIHMESVQEQTCKLHEVCFGHLGLLFSWDFHIKR